MKRYDDLVFRLDEQKQKTFYKVFLAMKEKDYVPVFDTYDMWLINSVIDSLEQSLDSMQYDPCQAAVR